jgi:REP element-mobilizing transposase RayT
MASTYTSLHYHLIFSTKNREPVIAPTWRTALHEYLGGTVKGLGGHPQGVGGLADHVHLLVALKPSHCLADFIRELKKASCAWVHANHLPGFRWQEGYAALTVSASARAAVKQYIAGQEEHHRVRTFRDELVAFLDKAHIPFDPRFLD